MQDLKQVQVLLRRIKQKPKLMNQTILLLLQVIKKIQAQIASIILKILIKTFHKISQNLKIEK